MKHLIFFLFMGLLVFCSLNCQAQQFDKEDLIEIVDFEFGAQAKICEQQNFIEVAKPIAYKQFWKIRLRRQKNTRKSNSVQSILTYNRVFIVAYCPVTRHSKIFV